MSRRGAAAALLAPFLPLMLAACGSSHDDDAPTMKVTELAAGAYAVSTGDAASPVDGKYYAGADGSRLLVLNNSDQAAAALYRRDGNGPWRGTPAADADTVVDLTGNNTIAASTPGVASVAGRYEVRLASGAAAAFSVGAGGDIVPGTTACRLSGKVAASTLPNTLKLTLATAGCGDLPAGVEGYLVIDADYAPAAFRLLGTGGTAPLDLWAYPG
ncbi:hypothetical protein EWM63_01000 [Pseudoduganella lutea]|uniref:Lipoprotein n=2 Tax=Pseudoduganella lutea TaxID=321985 RepID=A0A4P6L5Q4_9BURK|nr:hypothetical protein EWM63_01000 [Pseudoduganella lutea]